MTEIPSDLARAIREGVDARLTARLTTIADQLAKDGARYYSRGAAGDATARAITAVVEAIGVTLMLAATDDSAPREPAQDGPNVADRMADAHGAGQEQAWKDAIDMAATVIGRLHHAQLMQPQRGLSDQQRNLIEAKIRSLTPTTESFIVAEPAQDAKGGDATSTRVSTPTNQYSDGGSAEVDRPVTTPQAQARGAAELGRHIPYLLERASRGFTEFRMSTETAAEIADAIAELQSQTRTLEQNNERLAGTLAAAEARVQCAERLVHHILDHVETDENFSADEIRGDLRAFLDGTRTFDESKHEAERVEKAHTAGIAEGRAQAFEEAAQHIEQIARTIREDQMLNIPHLAMTLRMLAPAPAAAPVQPSGKHSDSEGYT